MERRFILATLNCNQLFVKHKVQFAERRKLPVDGFPVWLYKGITDMALSPSAYPTPGQYIQALLAQRGWSQRVLAIVLDMDETSINRLVADKRPVDAQMALLLAEVFDVRPEKFLQLQRRFDLNKARIMARPDPQRTTRADIFGVLPISEMIKRGWLPEAEDVRDVPRVEIALKRFFQTDSLTEIASMRHSAKKTAAGEPATLPQLAWLYRVQEITREMIVSKYSHEAARSAVDKLRRLLCAPEESRKVPRILAESGIRFAIVESLSGAKIDGVAFWLNAKSPVIALSMRYDRIDNFWFVLRHELEHILKRHGRDADRKMLDVNLEGRRAGSGPDVAEEESVANLAAQEFCVPDEAMKKFIARKDPFYAERDILGFAATIQVHPGLVAGQLQHQTERYDRFRNHLVKIREFVLPSAMVDGWGDVAPVGM
jgi:HTH-type transcriptional regulator / antitoxin HigA